MHSATRPDFNLGQADSGQVVAARRPGSTVATRPIWLDESLYPFESRYLTLESNRIHYIDEGNGPVLLFLHANPLWSFQYRNIITGLRDRFRCIALDYPGFGLSTAASGYHGTLLGTSRLVERFIRDLGLTDVTLVAHDSSVAVGLGVVGRYPEWFRGMALSNGFAWPLQENPGIYRFLKVAGSRPARFLSVNFNVLVRYSVKEIHGGKLTPAERAAYLGPFSERGRRHHIHDMFRSITNSSDYLSDLQERLRALPNVHTMPVLLLFADADPTYKAGFLGRLERMFPGHRSVLIAGSDHFPQEHAPEQMATAIRDWWDHDVERE